MAISGEYISLPGLVANATLAAKQYTPVRLASTANQIITATATTDLIIGVVQNDPAAGEAAVVAALGVCKAVAGTSTITKGDSLSANSTGVIDVTAGNVIGVALTAPTAKGDIITVLLSGLRPY